MSRTLNASWPWLRLLVNAVVTVGLAYALYRQFFVANHLPTLWVGFRQNLPHAFPYWIAATTALMPVNLLLEAYKLRVALPQNLRSSWPDTLGQVCAGIAVGLWTPGRVGEFAGRLARTRVEQRGAVLSATALGGIAQWSPLLVGGGAAVLFWRKPYTVALAVVYTDEGGTGLADTIVTAVGSGSIVIGLASGLIFWYVTDIVRALRSIRFPAWVSGLGARLRLGTLGRPDFLAAFERERRGLLAASAARYLVYLAQMSMAFVAFGLPTTLLAAIAGTAALLLLHGFLPLPPALQVVARIEFALLLFAYCRPNEVSIAAASLFVFALNLGLPALSGWLFIVRRNVVSHSR